MFRMTPPPARAISAPKVRLQRNAPVSPTRRSASHTLSGRFSRRDHVCPERSSIFGLLAALFTRMSTRPKRDSTASRMRSISSSWPMSTARPGQSRPNASETWTAAASRRGPGRSTRTGMPPASAMISACLRPSNPAPPVITATRPSRSKRREAADIDFCAVRSIVKDMSEAPGLAAVGHEAAAGEERSPLRA